MKPISAWFDEYGQSHKNQTNKLIHWICVPLIFFSIVALLGAIPADFLKEPFSPALRPYIHFGTLLILFGLFFYIRLSLPMAIGIFLFSLLCLQGVIWLQMLTLPLWLSSVIIFAGAWIGQFIGHKIEGKKPSFFKDIQFLLIGPAWLLGFAYQKLGIKY